MTSYGICPQCSTSIEQQRLSQGIVACQACGWTDGSKYRKVFRLIERKAIRAMILVSAAILGTFYFSANTSASSNELFALKLKSALGMDTLADYQNAIQVCRAIQKMECLDNAYSSLLRKDPNNIETLAEYGRLLESLDQDEKALPILSRYFSIGGNDVKTGFAFAKVLAATGKIESAERYFLFVIDSEPKVIQVTVLRSYVDMLIQVNRHADAQKIIEKFKADQEDVMIAGQLAEIKKLLAAR